MAKYNPAKWQQIINSIFSNHEISTTEWRDQNSIIEILNKIGSVREANHMFVPSKGGLDLAGARISNEEGCIELLTCGGNVSIIRPSRLTFNWFGQENLEWSYFRLDTDLLMPTGIYGDKGYQQEEVTELTPGEYVDYNVWESGEYNGKLIPNTARPVRRVFAGSFVIFPKESIYNLDLNKIGLGDAYDARHNQMSSSEFSQYIQTIINKLSEITNSNN